MRSLRQQRFPHWRGNITSDLKEGTPLANVMLTIAQKFGAQYEHFGISTGALEL